MAEKFEMVKLLGRGSFGQAWLARRSGQTGDNRKELVVKKVQLALLSEKDLDQALTEVAVLARCRHTNVVRYCEAFVHNGLLHVVMEYADGGDLRDNLTKQQGVYLQNEVILDWFVQLCFAAQYIHRRNILHRGSLIPTSQIQELSFRSQELLPLAVDSDGFLGFTDTFLSTHIKSQNIFLTSEGIVKLGDFGISRVLGDQNDLAQTAIGTPFYLSPEICQRRPYNHKSDIWSLGCVLYEMCSLNVPFDAPNFVLLATKIIQCDYKPLPKQFGPTLEDLVRVLLSIDPESRPSAEQILCIPALEQIVESYVQRQKVLVRSNRPSVSSDSPEPCRINRFQQKPGSPSCSTAIVVSPIASKPADHAKVAVSPKIRDNVYQHPGSFATPKCDGTRKRKGYLNGLKQDNKTPPGSAEARSAKLKKLEGATPHLSHLVHRQRAAKSAHCMRGDAMTKGPAPKLSIFHEISKKRAFSIDSRQQINSATYKIDGLPASPTRCVLSGIANPLV